MFCGTHWLPIKVKALQEALSFIRRICIEAYTEKSGLGFDKASTQLLSAHEIGIVSFAANVYERVEGCHARPAKRQSKYKVTNVILPALLVEVAVDSSIAGER